MQTHIAIELDRLALSEREAEWNRAHEADEERQAERAREDAYLARSRASYAAGEPEEVFEAREAAMAAEQYRITERLNADILQLFARCAPRRFEEQNLSEFVAERKAAADRRAA